MVTNRFRPRPPWWGPDLQTLRNTICSPPPEPAGGERLILPLGDGDALAARLDRPGAAAPMPLAVLVPGLTGTEASTYMVTSARALLAAGYPVLRLNLRGSALSRPYSGGHYHAGRTADLAAALAGVPAPLTRQGIVLIGYSLGGNMVLKFMGEGGHGWDIRAAVSVSAPIDLAATSRRMLQPRNLLYRRHLLRAMQREALAPGARLTEAERRAIQGARTVFEFDDRFMAPRFFYADAADYYAQNSAKRFLAGITRPCLMIHALDDPWIPADCYTGIDWAALPMIRPLLSPGGGHVGFHAVGADLPWHDRMIGQFLADLAIAR